MIWTVLLMPTALGQSKARLYRHMDACIDGDGEACLWRTSFPGGSFPSAFIEPVTLPPRAVCSATNHRVSGSSPALSLHSLVTFRPPR